MASTVSTHRLDLELSTPVTTLERNMQRGQLEEATAASSRPNVNSTHHVKSETFLEEPGEPHTELSLKEIAGRVHDEFAAQLKPGNLGSLCAFMTAAVIDQLLPGTATAHQLGAIVDAALAEIVLQNVATSEEDPVSTFWVPDPVAIKAEPLGRTEMISTAMCADSGFLRLIELAPVVSTEYIELHQHEAAPEALDGIKCMLRRASFDLTRSKHDSHGFVRSLD